MFIYFIYVNRRQYRNRFMTALHSGAMNVPREADALYYTTNEYISLTAII